MNYINIINKNIFGKIDLSILLLFTIYYFIKNNIIYNLGKRRYKNTISDVKQIIEED